jgi:thiol-disulfide isomerase/thioredoxin
VAYGGRISRRAALGGLAAAFAAPAWAQGGPAAVLARGPLADNPLAQRFQAAPRGMMLPDVALETLTGTRRFSHYRGRTLLISLWAEWCAPCLVEMPEFAELQARYGGGRFEILPVLTGSRKKLGPRGAAALLAKLKADRFEPLVEANSGDRLLKSLTFGGGAAGARPTLPCNLLVDSRGRVRARQFGAMPVPVAPPTQQPSRPRHLVRRSAAEQSRQGLIERSVGGATSTLWTSPAGHQLAAALSEGLLDRV